MVLGCRSGLAMKQNQQALFLAGPTAAGKTGAAHLLARDMGAAILSADAMLVYRGMDIGTAKPTADERAGIVYGGIDLVEPHEQFNVGRYMEHASRFLAEHAHASASWPTNIIVTGGTGLYIKTLTQGLDALPTADPAIRLEAEQVLTEQGLDALQAKVRQVDPERFAALADKQNPRRLVRAYELARMQVGKPVSWQRQLAVKLVGLRWSHERLNKRIALRARKMFEQGLLEETDRLLAGPGWSHTSAQAIGYLEAARVLRGEMDVEQAIEAVAVRTRRLAKRQMTWFRNQADMIWIEVDNSMHGADIAKKIRACWREHGPTDVIA